MVIMRQEEDSEGDVFVKVADVNILSYWSLSKQAAHTSQNWKV